MNKFIVFLLLFFFNAKSTFAQEWMTSLPIAKKLALAQNKFLFMMWEESALYQGPVFMSNPQNVLILERDFLNNKKINEAIWEHFVPVIVNESDYDELYEKVKGKRTQSYLTSFNDDSMKIIDPNGNIIGTSPTFNNFLNLSKFLKKYSYKTVLINEELANYCREKDFYSALYLANKYVDFAVYVNNDIRKDILNLSAIYYKEAEALVSYENREEQLRLQQRMELYKLSLFLVQKRPKKVLRSLKNMDSKALEDNHGLEAFLTYTAYLMLEDKKNAALWKNKLSLVNLKKAQLISKL